MRVVLAYPTWTGAYGILGHFARKNSRWPPLNLALIGACLEEAGHEVIIIDAELTGMDHRDLVFEILQEQPDVLGFTAFSPFFHINKEVAEMVRELDPTIHIVIGGPHITIMKDAIMYPCFDALFTGEAERTFPDYLDKVENNSEKQRTKALKSVKGLIFREDGDPEGNIVNTGPPPPILPRFPGDDHVLDQFPWPARHLLPTEEYRLGTLRGRLPFTSIQTMRGCPWKCIFCASDALQTTRVIKRSPKSIVEEMAHVVHTWDVRHFYIVDDVLTLWPDHITEICERIKGAGLDITFESSTRANLITEELTDIMVDAGLIRLSFGLETVDTEMRKTMGKKVPLRWYEESNKILNDRGVEVLNSVMLGLPGETRETVNKTLRFLETNKNISQANFAIAVPYPGTELHRMAMDEEHGIKMADKDNKNFENHRRYGSATMQVNDLSPQDLVELQNEGFIRIYIKPWRWPGVYHKHGVFGLFLTLWRVGKMVGYKLSKRKAKEAVQDINDLGIGKISDAPEAAQGHAGTPKSPNLL
jgi:anaerobic magnesium-protoporphyrin IX monomethyl ester cyclase